MGFCDTAKNAKKFVAKKGGKGKPNPFAKGGDSKPSFGKPGGFKAAAAKANSFPKSSDKKPPFWAKKA